MSTVSQILMQLLVKIETLFVVKSGSKTLYNMVGKSKKLQFYNDDSLANTVISIKCSSVILWKCYLSYKCCCSCRVEHVDTGAAHKVFSKCKVQATRDESRSGGCIKARVATLQYIYITNVRSII